MSKFKIEQKYIDKIDEVLARGLCVGPGDKDGSSQMCVEQVICYALGEPLGGKPTCVASAVISFGAILNDRIWASPEARAKGMRDLAIAQLGSKGVVDGRQFSKVLIEKTIRVLIPALFREVFPGNREMLEAADRCEKEGTKRAANAAANAAAEAAYPVYAVYTSARAAARAEHASSVAHAADAADATNANAAYAAYAANAANATIAYDAYADDKYLILSARLAVEALQELKSPGCAWL